MAWEHLSVNKPHLVYIILGGFTTIFMLVSSVIKERLYIGEATVATICGIIFGPHAANLIDPGTWGNTDQITLEFSRIVLVVQCFAVGVELPKAYMERHWRSVVFLLVPVMTFGWLVTSLFIWAVFKDHMNWLDSLCIAACVTATDPVLAASVVGKGKFAKRVPKHLRDLLSAESGCNDGMAFPFIYLAIYIIRYKGHPDEVALHWFCYTILYECLFGAIYGVAVGYIARRLIRWAHEKDIIDRESFLVFYFVLALFCAGSGSMLGMDDLLVGFAAGVGFSNDGWFTAQTEESHVSNVIDLLINLAFFVYFGTIIPWAQYNAGYLGLDVWRLVVIAILVIFFRRIPIMLALKPLIPDIKTWREALFAGHFGPIGVGAIFVAILARAELETEETTPLEVLPPPDFPHDNIIELIWPITTFLVITSIVVHGSSIAVFTLGKHINTLTLTMSYTQAQENGPSWMERLPRIQSRSKSSMSRYDSELDEKEKGPSPADLKPGTFLRRQAEEDNPSRAPSRNTSRHRSRKSKNFDNGRGPGGPISESAIRPSRREEASQPVSRSGSETLAAKSDSQPESPKGKSPEERGERDDDAQSPGEIFEQGEDTVFEDEDGKVLAVENESGVNPADREAGEVMEGKRLMREESAKDKDGDDGARDVDGPEETEAPQPKMSERPAKNWRRGLNKAGTITKLAGLRNKEDKPKPEPRKTNGPARAYQYGNTIIVEDEDGEVIKKYDIPGADNGGGDSHRSRQRVARMGKMLGLGGADGNETPPSTTAAGEEGAAEPKQRPKPSRFGSLRPAAPEDEEDDEQLRFTISTGTRRMSKAEFIDQIRGMDPKARVQAVEASDAPEIVKKEARKDAREQAAAQKGRGKSVSGNVPVVHEQPDAESNAESPGGGGRRREAGNIERADSSDSADLKLVDSNNEQVPFHDLSSTVRNFRQPKPASSSANRSRATDDVSPGSETAAQARRRAAAQASSSQSSSAAARDSNVETAAERRRREGALGISKEEDSSESEEESGEPRQVSPGQRGNIRFADGPSPPARAHVGAGGEGRGEGRGGIRWGSSVKG
ncbi:hypothetical protein B0A48_04623 [Cryoendolithus antarcticus]|uniref:Na(+)/H(+) antiporter n=1 Tax=Cryoendolithus antarcticus TaxID=1507870 RepID=A0A1V8TFW9_9PEZI|nr:hypothetical protein B0A48_04623 [Cryoendolithus antarcticus]